MSRTIAAVAMFFVLAMSLVHCTAGSVGSPIAEPTSSDAGAGAGSFSCGSKTCTRNQFCDSRTKSACVTLPSSCNGKASCDCITLVAPGCCITDLPGQVTVAPTGSCS